LQDICGTTVAEHYRYVRIHSILSFRHKVSESSPLRNSGFLRDPFALCLKRKSAQDVCPFGKFSIVMEERFAARNCYWENEHSDALSSNTKARSLPNSMIAKVGVNRISQCARRCSAITKIDRDRRWFESRRSFIVSPVVNAQMLPILTRAKNYLFPFRFPTLTKYKSFFSSKLNVQKYFKGNITNIHVQRKCTL